ncbi:hypothetical protein ACWWBI_00880, partial [Pseudomonas aeruginosa]
MPASLLVLALSAFAIGTTEFVIMGLLPRGGGEGGKKSKEHRGEGGASAQPVGGGRGYPRFPVPLRQQAHDDEFGGT